MLASDQANRLDAILSHREPLAEVIAETQRDLEHVLGYLASRPGVLGVESPSIWLTVDRATFDALEAAGTVKAVCVSQFPAGGPSTRWGYVFDAEGIPTPTVHVETPLGYVIDHDLAAENEPGESVRVSAANDLLFSGPNGYRFYDRTLGLVVVQRHTVDAMIGAV